jgi:hypothetical protein
MDDNHLDLLLHEHFDKKMSPPNDLVLKTKQRLREKAEKKNNLMLCLIQLGFLLMTAVFVTLALITLGIGLTLIVSIAGYAAAVGLAATLLALSETTKTKSLRRTEVYE